MSYTLTNIKKKVKISCYIKKLKQKSKIFYNKKT